MRIVAIWVFGLLASGIFGGIIGNFLSDSYSTDGAFFGFLGGVFAFACARLWLSAPKKHNSN
jgi:membrane associated rhomboid family serine protease